MFEHTEQIAALLRQGKRAEARMPARPLLGRADGQGQGWRGD